MEVLIYPIVFVFVIFLLYKYRSWEGKGTEEDRLFMVIRLKNAKEIAANLGHLRYCELLQTSFAAVRKVSRKNRAKVYQYYDDGAMLTWSFEKGMKGERFLQAFFDFEELIQKRMIHIEKTFNLKPEFIGGVHGGTVALVFIGLRIHYYGVVVHLTEDLTENNQKDKLVVTDVLQGIMEDDAHTFEKRASLKLPSLTKPLTTYSVLPK